MRASDARPSPAMVMDEARLDGPGQEIRVVLTPLTLKAYLNFEKLIGWRLPRYLINYLQGFEKEIIPLTQTAFLAILF
jgi:hypothetical protein